MPVYLRFPKWLALTLLFPSFLVTVPAMAGNTLMIVTEDYPPFNYQVKDVVTGISSDILRKALDRAGVGARFTLYPWLRAYGAALHDPDTCVYSTTRTPERDTLFKWVGPLVLNNWVLFGRSDNKRRIHSLLDVKNTVIGGYQGDAVALYLQSQGLSVETVNSDRLNPRKLRAGRIDYWATGEMQGSYLIHQEQVDNLKVVFTFRKEPLYLACNKSVGDDVINRLNQALASLVADGTVGRVNQAYR